MNDGTRRGGGAGGRSRAPGAGGRGAPDRAGGSGGPPEGEARGAPGETRPLPAPPDRGAGRSGDSGGGAAELAPQIVRNLRIVLVEPSHPGNVGASARAMKAMGLRELWLVAPRRFPCAEATERAAGAGDLLFEARVCERLEDAIEDARLAVGTTARTRHLEWSVEAPRGAAPRIVERAREGPVALVFGRERTGLTNRELELCEWLIRFPTSERFRSLNLAAAVQLLAYELRLAGLGKAAEPARSGADGRAGAPGVPPRYPTVAEREGLFEHLERTLIALGYLDPARPRLLMRRLRRLLNRARVERSELNILRGILGAVDALVERTAPGEGEGGKQ